MDPVAAGKLETPVMRPLVVVSPSPFQITRVESTNPRFRCDLPAARPAATVHRLPVVFLGGDTPGKVEHADSHSDNRFGGTARGRSEHQLDPARRRGKTADEGRPKASRSRQAGGRAGRSGVWAARHGLQAAIFHCPGVEFAAKPRDLSSRAPQEF